MSSLLDVIFSIIIGGFLFLLVLNTNDMAFDNQQETHGTMLVQEEMTAFIEQLEGEFRNAGSGSPMISQTILRADSTAIEFISDLDGNVASIDTISYVLGTPAELLTTRNERDCPLYRSVNGSPWQTAAHLTVLRCRYFDATGSQLPVPVPSDRLAEVHSIEVTAEIQNPYGVHMQTGQEIYPTSMWQQTRLSARNLKR